MTELRPRGHHPLLRPSPQRDRDDQVGSPEILAQGTDWRFLNELTKELERMITRRHWSPTGLTAAGGFAVSTPRLAASEAVPRDGHDTGEHFPRHLQGPSACVRTSPAGRGLHCRPARHTKPTTGALEEGRLPARWTSGSRSSVRRSSRSGGLRAGHPPRASRSSLARIQPRGQRPVLTLAPPALGGHDQVEPLQQQSPAQGTDMVLPSELRKELEDASAQPLHPRPQDSPSCVSSRWRCRGAAHQPGRDAGRQRSARRPRSHEWAASEWQRWLVR